MALVGECDGDQLARLRVATALERVVGRRSDVMAFVIDRLDGFASFGFARHQWSIDLLEWVYQHDVPKSVTHQVLGLLLGYSSDEIERHGRQDGRRFDCSGLINA